MTGIAETAKIYPGVELGTDVEIGDFCIIGVPVKNAQGKKTIIGAGSRIRSHTVMYAGSIVGLHFQTGHGAMIRENCTIGSDVSIGSHTVVEHSVQLEDQVRIHSQAFVPELSVLKKGAWIGPNAVLTNARYPLSKGVKETLLGPVIGEGAIVGANASLLPGVELGAHCLVGAGSVVTKNVAAKAVVAGNPARVINQTDKLPYEHK